MTMYRKYHYGRGGDAREFSAAEAVEYAIDDAPDYESGQLERIDSKIRKLTDTLCAILKRLPDADQREVVSEVAYQFEAIKK